MRNPCKYCGAKPTQKVEQTLKLIWLQCRNCGSKNMTTMEHTMESATVKWNEKNPLPREEK